MPKKGRKKAGDTRRPRTPVDTPTAMPASAARRWTRRARVGIVLGLLLSLLGALWYPWDERPPAAVLVQSTDRLDPRITALIDEHVRRVRESPRSARAHGHLGMVYEANALWQEAGQCYLNAERLAPEDPNWPLHRSITMRSTGDVAGALAVVRQLAGEHPDYAALQQRYGESLLESGEVDTAVSAFERVIALASDSSAGYVGLADARLREHKYADAKRLLDTAVAMDPTYQGARYLLGLAHRGLGEYEEAKEQLALGLDSKRRLMRDELTTTLESYSVGVSAQLTSARRYKTQGRLDEAAEALENARSAGPDNTEVLNELALVYLAQQRPAEALELLTRVQALGHAPIATYVNLATCYSRMNRPADALASVERAVAMSPDDHRMHFARAGVLAGSRRFEEALASLNTAARLAPHDADISMKQGQVCLLLDRNEEARQHYATAANLMPNSVVVQLGLGDVLIRLGRWDEAAAALAAAGSLDPSHPGVSMLNARLAQVRNR